ncbi:hypothetical protein [Arthrobacter castelli]|uniref:hypothetical protein n=1 Tax=Arthrobacter castelli TaxID=271431 RepID=UPI0004202899|nr:hypothetical protein [Arthrobacter castelli]
MAMTRATMTTIGLALGPLLLLLLDVIVTQTIPGGVFNDFFELLRATAVAAWPVGLLIGHWYGPRSLTRLVPSPLRYIILIGGSLAVMGLSLLFLGTPGASDIVSTAALCTGAVAGAVLWPVQDPSRRDGQ